MIVLRKLVEELLEANHFDLIQRSIHMRLFSLCVFAGVVSFFVAGADTACAQKGAKKTADQVLVTQLEAIRTTLNNANHDYEGHRAAAICALNALAVLEAELGTLDRVERVLSVTGFVASAPDFHRQPDVVDGASKVLYDVFGEAGRHTRSAIGVAALPRGGAVEIELTVSLRD